MQIYIGYPLELNEVCRLLKIKREKCEKYNTSVLEAMIAEKLLGYPISIYHLDKGLYLFGVICQMCVDISSFHISVNGSIRFLTDFEKLFERTVSELGIDTSNVYIGYMEMESVLEHFPRPRMIVYNSV